MQAIQATRPGGSVGYVACRTCRAQWRGSVLQPRPPARWPCAGTSFLPELIDLVWSGRSIPEKCST